MIEEPIHEGFPLVSMVIPAFNASATLANALESLRVQTFGDFEAVVIDDGSTDDTGRIALAFAEADSRFRALSRVNEGVSAARNAGLAHVRGKWVAFLDADDELCPTWLEGMLAGIEDEVDMVCGGATVVRAGSDCVETKCHKKKLLLTGDGIRYMAESILDNENHEMEGFCPEVSGYVWAKLFRKQLLSGTRFDQQIGMREDALFNIEFLSQSRAVAIVPESGYIYRLQENSSSVGFRDGYETEIERFLLSCHDVWSSWHLDLRSFDKGVLLAYMSWLKLYALHPEAPFSKLQQRRLIKQSFSKLLWLKSIKSVSNSDLSIPYRLLKHAYVVRSVCGIRVLKWLNDVRKLLN